MAIIVLKSLCISTVTNLEHKLLHNIVGHIFGSKEQDAQLSITVDPRIIRRIQCTCMEGLVHVYQNIIRLKFHIRGSQHSL